MTEFQPLAQVEEDELHAKRLLNIEEKTFKRIQKRLLATTNPFSEYLRRAPVDSTAGNGEIQSDEEAVIKGVESSQDTDAYLKTLQQFHHSTLHDFNALRMNLARLQFMLAANEKERQRYARQSTTIIEQHTDIKQDTARLRARLGEAREQLHVRKRYDDLADKVLYVDAPESKEKVLAKTRDELGRESDKLRNEIDELEREGVDLSNQWADRQAALSSVVSESARLRRVVRGEPENVEEEKQDHDMNSEFGDEGDAIEKTREDDEDGLLIRRNDDGASNVGTPRPTDEAATPLPDDAGGSTPLPLSSRAATPQSTDLDLEQLADEHQAPDSKLHQSMTMDDVDMPEEDAYDDQGIPEVKVENADTAEGSDMELA